MLIYGLPVVSQHFSDLGNSAQKARSKTSLQNETTEWGVGSGWVNSTLGRAGFDPWVRKIPWRREWQPTLVFLPGEFHEQKSLVGYSPCGLKELDTTERLTLSLFRYIRLWCNMKKNVVNMYITQYSVNTILPSLSISLLSMTCIYFKFQQCNH